MFSRYCKEITGAWIKCLVDDKIIPGNTFAIPLVEQSNTIDKKPFHFKYIWEINTNFVKQFFKFKELSKAGKFSQTRV